jgi:hypothetical protein
MSFRPLDSQAPVESRNQTPATHAKAIAADRDRARRQGLLLLAFFIVAGMLAVLATQVSAQGQKYDSFPQHEALKNPDNVKKCIAATKAFSTTGAGNPGMVGGYFKAYVPFKMTEPDSILEMTELMTEINTFLARASRSNKQGVAQKVTKDVHDGMKMVAEGNYHPAARINATLTLGRLNDAPANSQTRTPPVPMLQALPTLLKLYNDENNVDGIRAAALQGIHRHALYGFYRIPQAERAQLTAKMKELLDASAPAGRPENAHAYLQRFAVDIIERLRDGQDKSLGTTLVTISTEPSKHDLIALYSASRIGALGSELNGSVDKPEEILKSWSRRAYDAFSNEVARLKGIERIGPAQKQPQRPEDFLRKSSERSQGGRSPGGMEGEMGMGMGDMEGMMGDMEDSMGDMEDMGGMGDMMGEMMGGMMGSGGLNMQPKANPQPPEVIASRKRLSSVMQQLQLGATGSPSPGMPRNPGGLLVSVDEANKKVVEDWVTEMETVLTTLNDEFLDNREKYLEGIEAQIEPLRKMAGVIEEAPERDALDALDGTELDALDAPAGAEEPAEEPNALDELQ